MRSHSWCILRGIAWLCQLFARVSFSSEIFDLVAPFLIEVTSITLYFGGRNREKASSLPSVSLSDKQYLLISQSTGTLVSIRSHSLVFWTTRVTCFIVRFCWTNRTGSSTDFFGLILGSDKLNNCARIHWVLCFLMSKLKSCTRSIGLGPFANTLLRAQTYSLLTVRFLELWTLLRRLR